jgi:alcohol dehydrogenase
VGTYTQTPPDVPIGSVRECVDRATRAEVDVVIGIGGGSVLDMPKLTSLLLSHPGDIARYYGENKVRGPCRPVIALPTTAGTGSEVSPVAVLHDPDIGISSPYLASAAVCDPAL